MFVVSMMHNGSLIKTAVRGSANDAVQTAHEWRDAFQGRIIQNSYICIDQKVPNKQENVRFAEIRLEQNDDQVRLYLNGKMDEPVFASKLSVVTQHFLISFLEHALFRLVEYLKEKPK